MRIEVTTHWNMSDDDSTQMSNIRWSATWKRARIQVVASKSVVSLFGRPPNATIAARESFD